MAFEITSTAPTVVIFNGEPASSCCNAEVDVRRTVSDEMQHWPQYLDDDVLYVGEGHHKQCLDSGDFVVRCKKCNTLIETQVEEV